MNRPRFMRHLYNRWLFLAIGLAGLGNIVLLTYRFVILGLVAYPVEHIAAAIFSFVTCALSLAVFADLSLRRPDKFK